MKFFNFIVLLFSAATVFAQQDCSVPYHEKVDCLIGADKSEAACHQAGCLWCPTPVDELNVPFCYLPKSYGYKLVETIVDENGNKHARLRRNTSITYFGSDSEEITVSTDMQSDYRLRIKITDGTQRFEVPLEINPAHGGSSNPLVDIEFVEEPTFSIKVTRKSSGAVLFDTSLGGLTFSDQFLQISTKLPSVNVYGIGENEQHTFRHSFVNTPVWSLYARDQTPNGAANIYGVQPHYTVLENDGKAHSVAIVNSNAQDFTLHPHPGIVYRTIGGIIDIYMFFGPTPENTVQQYTEAVGRTQIPPYWALGFQLCKYGYDTLENMKAVVDRTAQYNIPHDVQYGDIDIMDRSLDFTISQDRFGGLPEYVRELKAKGVKFMTILDPAISNGEPSGTYRPFELGNEMDVWTKRPNGEPASGIVWPPSPTQFPDYFKNSTRQWWITLITEFAQVLEFDALWIDMNEPANFMDGDLAGCAENKWNNPPWVPGITGGSLNAFTLCADTQDSLSIHYNTHSLYGWSESEPTIAATTAALQRRTFALSRSTFLGSGKWVSHWLGDNHSKWTDLQYSIIGMLQFNQFGLPFVGPDICGHVDDATKELCQRWQELGAFYPFSRNHNAKGYIDQDPAVWGADVAESTRKALEIRYTLLPYLYTLLAEHYMFGNTVARALWHEFSNDTTTFGIDRQFLWGSGLMISPVLDVGQNVVRAYFPADRFFNYHNGIEVGIRAAYDIIDAPIDHINLHLHGGNIMPMQEPAVNTELSRQNPLGLIVALNDWGTAEGTMYYDAGNSLGPIESGEYYYARYNAADGVLTTTILHDGYIEMATKRFNTIRLLGAVGVNGVTINGASHKDFIIRPSGEIVLQNLSLVANSAFTITYN